MAALPSLPGLRVLVGGGRAAGTSVARFLIEHGAQVCVVDARVDLVVPDARVVTEAQVSSEDLLAECDLVVVSPGFRPTSPLAVAAESAGVPVWGDVEFAWHVDQSGVVGPPRTWLAITGTNGKTTTTSMTEAMVAAAGESVLACGNIGLSVIDALCAHPRADFLAVELSSFQLYWAPSVRPAAGVVLNIAEDHLDWHGSMAAYIEAKAQVLTADTAIVGGDDPIASQLLTASGATPIYTTVHPPPVGAIGVVDNYLVDNAFANAMRLAPADSIAPAGPSGVADAAAAAALCRSQGISADAIAAALADFVPGRHRGEVIAQWGNGVAVDDSKATNPHAAIASIVTYHRVVLIAGGQLKGASMDELIERVAPRLQGVVAIGLDRQIIADAFARHASLIPIVTLFTGDDGDVNATAVDLSAPEAAHRAAHACAHVDHILHSRADLPQAAADLVMFAAVAAAGDLIGSSPEKIDAMLLAPAAASLDMFVSYGERGDSFASAVHALGVEV